MTPIIRLLPFASDDGPSNMAMDEAMLETASTGGTASLRFYTWSEPTLSLGYFQPSAIRDQTPHVNRIPSVRRSTGGEAIVHHRELTYGLALPPGKPWHIRGESWVCRFHHIVQLVLSEDGLDIHGVRCGEEKRLGEALCFLHQTPADLTSRGSKIVGSAQRKLLGAVLQHGSLLLDRSEFAPGLPGINDIAGRDLYTPEALAQRLADRFEKETGWSLKSSPWSSEEWERIAVIRARSTLTWAGTASDKDGLVAAWQQAGVGCTKPVYQVRSEL